MRAKTFLGTLLLSVLLCSPAFSGEVLARILGLETFTDQSCGSCTPCQPACKTCEPACSDCEPACCPRVRDKLCRLPVVCKLFCCPETECCEPCCGETCCDAGCKPRWTPVRDTLDGIRNVICCKRCCTDCCCADCGCSDCGGDGCGYSSVSSDKNTAPAKAPVKHEPTPAPEPPKAAPIELPEPSAIPPAPGQ